MDRTSDERELRELRENWRQAVMARDVDRVMSFYADGADYRAFDLMPPMAFPGGDVWRKNWIDFFAMFESGPVFEYQDVRIHCSGDLGAVTGFTRLTGQVNGAPMDMWTRETNLFCRIDGLWLLVHDHVSVPIDVGDGRAWTTLTP